MPPGSNSASVFHDKMQSGNTPINFEMGTSYQPGSPTSPNKLRAKLDFAKANAKNYELVIDEGEVIHWMSVISPDLVEYGRHLVEKGYVSLDSVAMLVEDDILWEMKNNVRESLIKGIRSLRHEIFRM